MNYWGIVGRDVHDSNTIDYLSGPMSRAQATRGANESNSWDDSTRYYVVPYDEIARLTKCQKQMYGDRSVRYNNDGKYS